MLLTASAIRLPRKDPLMMSPRLDTWRPADSSSSPRSSVSLVVCFSSACILFSSAVASLTACFHLRVRLSVSPYFFAAASRPFCSCSTRRCWTSICWVSTRVWAVSLAWLLSFLSKAEVTAFISLARVLACWMMLFSSFRYCASPSIPILGPMFTAKRSPQFQKIFYRLDFPLFFGA